VNGSSEFILPIGHARPILIQVLADTDLSRTNSAESLQRRPAIDALLMCRGPVLGDSPFLSRGSLVKPFGTRQLCWARQRGTASFAGMLLSIRAQTNDTRTMIDDFTHRVLYAQQSMRQRRHGSGGPKMDLAPDGLCRSAWIAHCTKRLFGLAVPERRLPKIRAAQKAVAAIKQAFRRFGLL